MGSQRKEAGIHVARTYFMQIEGGAELKCQPVIRNVKHHTIRQSPVLLDSEIYFYFPTFFLIGKHWAL